MCMWGGGHIFRYNVASKFHCTRSKSQRVYTFIYLHFYLVLIIVISLSGGLELIIPVPEESTGAYSGEERAIQKWRG